MFRFLPLRIRSKNGALLLETLLSIVILATGLTVMVQAMTVSLRAMAYSARYSQMASALENEMARQIFAGLTGGDLPRTDERARNDEPYEILASSRPINGVDRQRLRELILTASWESRRKGREVSIHTYISEAFNRP